MSILEGVRVLDLGTGLAAPYAAMLLADLGADVTKVEKPKRGDLIRFTDDYIHGKSGYFLGINRGKRSVTLDLRTPRGRELVLKLCETIDILIENFTGGVLDSWGLSYDEVRAVAPGIIYCSVSAFGSVPGFEKRSGNDITAQAYSGLMALTGDEHGEPAKAGAPVTDVAAASMATIATLAALIRRDRTGKGAHVKTSLIEAAFALMPNFSASVLNGAPNFRRLGSGHPQLAPYKAYRTADAKFVVLGVFHQESWERLGAAIARSDLVVDPRFKNNTLRVKNRHELDEAVGKEIVEQPLAHWVRVLDEHDVPFSPVLEFEESLELFGRLDPGLLVTEVPSNAGPITMLRSPFAIDGERPSHPQGAPTLGEHTESVLAGLGLTSAQIDELRRDNVI